MEKLDYIEWSLIIKKLQKNTNSEEDQIFQKWYDANAHNRIYFEKAKVYFERYYTGNDVRVIDEDGAWNEFLSYTQKRKTFKISRLLKYVAIFLCPILGCYLTYTWLSASQARSLPVAQQEITPGGTKAILILGSGKEIILDNKTVQDCVAKESNTVINNQDHELLYDKKGASGNTIIKNTIIIPRGGEYRIKLSDGTQIALNSDSQLVFPVEFTDKERRVQLTGEAYFQVAHQDSLPFIVETSSGEVKVLGTTFNIKAYPNDNEIQTTLINGSIAFRTPGKYREYIIKPGEQVVYDKLDYTTSIREVNTDAYCGWKDGKFILEGERLEDIMKQLARWYDVEVFFQSAEIKNLVFTGDLEKYENFDVVLNMIKLSTNVEFVVKGRTITVKIK